MPLGPIIMAAGSIGGALISSGAQKSASNQANAAQQAATNAQLQLGQESLALNKDIYNSNYATLSPFVSRGNVAGTAINALLGLPSAPVMQSPLAGTAMGSGTVPAPTGGAPSPLGANSLVPAGIQHAPVYNQTPVNASMPGELLGAGRTDLGLPTIGPQALGAQTSAGAGTGFTRNGYPIVGANGTAAHTPANPPAPGSPAPSAYNAFQDFANSAGMKFQQQQAADALNNKYAAAGLLQSGAAMKAIPAYLQQQALNNYFLPYMGLLGGQQAVGAQSASSIAGVGSSFGNTAANINSQMGASIGQGADAAAQNAYNRGAANAGMYGQIGSALGALGSSFFPAGGGAASAPITSNYHYTGTLGGY